MGFGKELKRLREDSGMSARQLAEKIGVDAERLRKWELKDLTPRYEDRSIIEAFFKMTLEEFEKLKKIPELPNVPKETHDQDFTEKRRNAKLAANKRIPLYDAETSAGNVQIDMSPVHAASGTIDIGDLLNDSEAAIRIYGNSMIPNYPPGCVIGLRRHTDSFFQPGEVYVIETHNGRYIKRLFYKDDNPESDFITCYSDNIMKFEGGARHGKIAYPPFDIPKKEIKNIFTVTGVIKRNDISAIVYRS